MSGGAGSLILSIDLELNLRDQETVHQRQLDDVRLQLIELTQAYKIPATWAVADPALSAASESILAARCGHEIAVLGDQAWLGLGCGRARLARELARRFAGARKAGIPVSTLALRNVEQVIDLDLLIDHGVTAIRGPAVDVVRDGRARSTSPIRFGLWQPPVAWQIPPRTSWWTGGAWSVRRAIRRAVRQRSLIHLAIDAPRLIGQGDAALKAIARILRCAAAKRAGGGLAIRTVQQIAAEVLAQRAAVPSHSILRPAA
jgi:hypothetical protein